MRHIDMARQATECLTLATGPCRVRRRRGADPRRRAASTAPTSCSARQLPAAAGASPILGLEVSGTIRRARPGVTEWREGDTVCALVAGGGYAEYCVAPAPQCLPVRGVSPSSRAGLPETSSRYGATCSIAGRLAAATASRAGGSSGIGTTAIQLAHAFGARVFATAGAAKCADASSSAPSGRSIYRQGISRRSSRR